MDDQSTIVCNNCKREVSSANFMVHMAHCDRHRMVVCDQCDSPFPSAELEAHQRSAHAEVLCPIGCGRHLPQHLVDAHAANECPKRMVACQYCDMQVTGVDRIEHEDYCGSRTSRCDGCGLYVMDKFILIHLDSDHTFLSLEDDERPPRRIEPPVSFAVTDLGKSNLNAVDSSNVDVDRDRGRPATDGGSKRTNGVPQVNMCRDFVEKDLVEKLPIPGKRLDGGGRNLSEQFRNYADDYDYDSDEAAFSGPPEAAATPPSSRELDDTLDVHLAEQMRAASWLHPTSLEQMMPSVDVARAVPSSPPIFGNDVADVSTLPCEFCGAPLLADELLDHQAYCVELDSFAETGIDGGERRRPDHSDGAVTDDIVRPNPVNVKDVDDDDDGPVIIPCEYCGLPFQHDVIIQHETGCAGHRAAAQPWQPSSVREPMALANSVRDQIIAALRPVAAVPRPVAPNFLQKGLPNIRRVPIAVTPPPVPQPRKMTPSLGHRRAAEVDVDEEELALRQLRQLKMKNSLPQTQTSGGRAVLPSKSVPGSMHYPDARASTEARPDVTNHQNSSFRRGHYADRFNLDPRRPLDNGAAGTRPEPDPYAERGPQTFSGLDIYFNSLNDRDQGWPFDDRNPMLHLRRDRRDH